MKGWTSNKILVKTDDQKKGFKMFQEDAEEKVLGVIWNYVADEFSLKVKVDLLRLTDHSVDHGVKMTKKILLSQVSRFYDPIGFAAAFIIRAKIGLQELWQTGLHWDDKLPCNVEEKWIQFYKEMKELKGIGDGWFHPKLQKHRYCVSFQTLHKMHLAPVRTTVKKRNKTPTKSTLLQLNLEWHPCSNSQFHAWNYKQSFSPPASRKR